MDTVRRSFGQKARRLLADQGFGVLIEEIGARLRHRLQDPLETVPFHVFRTTDWDRRRDVQTEGMVEVDEFDRGIPNRDHAEAYLPTNLWWFRQLMGALLDLGIRPPEFTMVDLGCGKGRAVMMGVEMGFRRVIGVEFDPGLARCAAENLRRYRGSRRAAAPVHHADAAEFPIPAGPLVVFLFNPFRGPVLESVAENLRRSFAEDPRPMYVLYTVPRSDSPFRRGAPFRLVESGPRREIYSLEAEGS
jgi:hypothetical protein